MKQFVKLIECKFSQYYKLQIHNKIPKLKSQTIGETLKNKSRSQNNWKLDI